MTKNMENNRTTTFLEEESEEDWCFECKDGGQMVVCDQHKCGKVYHPGCIGKDDSFLDTAKSWVCGRHFCFDCKDLSKYYCIGCPNGVCRKCFTASEFTVVKGVNGLCIDCMELVKIIEQKLDHDSDGNKITLDDRETYECLFKEYWEIIKVKEGLTSDDIFAAKPNYKKSKSVQRCKENLHGEEEKQIDSMSWDSDKDYKPAKRKRYNSKEFMGWGSQPLISFLASIGKHETEPLTQWGVNSVILEYIKENNLHHPKDKGKFLPDEMLFPIFGKKVMSKSDVYPLLEFHFAKISDASSVEKNDDKIGSSSTDKHVMDQTTSMKRRLSSLNRKFQLKKGHCLIKPSRFASVTANNINLIYLKRSLVVELSKEMENFKDKVVGTFVKAKVDSIDSRQRKSYHLMRVLDVVFDEMSNGTLLQVSFMAKPVPISELSDDDFTEHECEDLRQKVKDNLLSKLTVVEVQEKAKFLHEDITNHRIRTRLVYLQNQIDRANLRGRSGEKIALLEEKEKLEKSWKQEQLLKSEPSVCPELNEPNYGDSEEGELERDTQDQVKRVCSLQNRISLEDRETYECQFQDWETIKVKEGSSSDDICASQPSYKKGKKISKGEEKQNDSVLWSWVSNKDNKPAKKKRKNSDEFVGWGSKPLISFLASIGKYETEPLARWDVNSIIHEYIKEKNLHHPRDKGKFLPDERLFPIFRKKVISKRRIYSLLGIHFAKEFVEKSDDKIRNSSTNKHLNNQATCMESRLSSLIGKPLLKKGDFFIKHSCFASINTYNINLIYLKQSLVLELSKQPESFMDKVVGSFVRARVDSNDSRQRKSHNLSRILGVEFDKMSNGTLLQVTSMSKAIPISELSNEEFTQQECEDLRQKVDNSLLPKLTVVEVQEKAKILHEDITKHRILTRLVYLQNQIERANLRGRNREKIALLEEKEELEQSWKQEELLRSEPSVRPELIEAKYDDSEDEIQME